MEGRKRPIILFARLLAFVVAALVASCGIGSNTSPESTPEPAATPTTSHLFAIPESDPAQMPEEGEESGETAVPPPGSADIHIDRSAEAAPIDNRILGTNLPAWLGDDRTENETFIARAAASGVTVVRIPGGSWSNGYDWLACETGLDIEGAESCWSRPGGLRPTDFINFIKTADTEAMYTVNHNGTAKEAAALVAFFNGSVDDETMIGADVRGRNWGKVSDWAQLRSDNGNPDPLNIQYWEIGNEIYGGQDGMGTDCSAYGWEEVWTCDGREYVQGIAGDDFRREGFLEFYNEMKKVDPA
ncbi:MAG: alpha-L-arabinofuranosidase, partial [Chloroflexi bacterium]|nr:alpha-L-arabinofuranosidase [Chloroflexota bacterium]